MPTKIPLTNRRSLALVGALIASVLYFAFRYLPAQSELHRHELTLTRRQTLLSQAMSIPNQLKQTSQRLQETSEYCGHWKALLPADGDISRTQTQFVKLAERSGAQVVDFNPSKPAAFAGFTRSTLKLKVRSTFPELVRLLADIEQTAPTTWLNQATIEASQEGEETLSCELNFAVFGMNSDFE